MFLCNMSSATANHPKIGIDKGRFLQQRFSLGAFRLRSEAVLSIRDSWLARVEARRTDPDAHV